MICLFQANVNPFVVHLYGFTLTHWQLLSQVVTYLASFLLVLSWEFLPSSAVQSHFSFFLPTQHLDLNWL